MRDILSKVMTGSMIAGAALLVTACGGGSTANNTATDNGLGTEVYNTDVATDANFGADFNASIGNGSAGNTSTSTTTTTNTVANTTGTANSH
jgi:hypothetical protein